MNNSVLYDDENIKVIGPNYLKKEIDNMISDYYNRIRFIYFNFGIREHEKVTFNIQDNKFYLNEEGMINIFFDENNLNIKHAMSYGMCRLLYNEIIINKNDKKRIKWLEEGISQYLSGYIVNLNFKEEINKCDDIAKIESEVILVKYLFENYDKDDLLSIFKNYDQIRILEKDILKKAEEYYNMNDCDIFKKQLERIHPDIYRYYSREDFDVDLEKLNNKKNLSKEELKVEYAKMLSKVKDGHTNIYFRNNVIYELRVLDDKVYVIDDYKENSNEIYKYITKINNTDINLVISKALACMSYETKNWVKYLIETRILSLELLMGLNIVKNDDFNIEFSDGTIINYKDKQKMNYIKEINNFDKKIINEDNYYVKYATCSPPGEMNLHKWFDDIINELKDNNICNLIIDLRGNTGGNSHYFSVFKDKLSKLNMNINYYTLIDRGVFSSGIFALNDMINLGSKVIGEEPGTTINHFGFVTHFTLPYSKINISCSNSEWGLDENKEYKRYRKKDLIGLDNNELFSRDPINIDVKIEEKIEDYVNDIDPYMEEINLLINSKSKTM